MSHREKSRPTCKGRSFWTALIFGPALLAGCATTAPEPEVSMEEVQALTQRVEDVERTNARLTVRVEEAERQHLLLQDRVESNRIALQRRGYMDGGNDRFARFPAEGERHRDERPAPAPESNYRQEQRGNYQADPSMRQRMDRRGVTRIPLSDGQSGVVDRDEEYFYVESDGQYGAGPDEGEEIVLTNEILDQRYGTSSSSSRQRSSQSSSSSDGQQRRRSAPHAPVTDERLPTTAELAEGESNPSSSQSGQGESLSRDEQFELYQDSLAQYRAGDYADALQGFKRFLNAGPRQDFVDNALYWIGECYYGLGNYETSVGYFQRIIDELPSADKVPDAMLKMSLAYDRLGQPERAVGLLRDLIKDYPTSNPGRLGKERLEEHPLANRE